MKGYIHYINDHTKSIMQAEEALRSFNVYPSWDCELLKGVTPKTIENEVILSTVQIKEASRLLDFKKGKYETYLTKLSCVMNHWNFFEKVIEADEPMAFIEHDAICIGGYKNWDFDEYLLLNAEFVFRKPNKLGLQQFAKFSFPRKKGVQDFPEDYPLLYYRENDWKGSMMAPGTGAYALTPKGAKKMLEVIESAVDQSDFLINSNNIRMQYIYPSPVKFNTVNLNTSFGV